MFSFREVTLLISEISLCRAIWPAHWLKLRVREENPFTLAVSSERYYAPQNCTMAFLLLQTSVNTSRDGEEPLHSEYRGYQIYVPPPNSYGILLLLQLKYLTNYHLATLKHNPREHVSLQMKAKKEAWKSGQRWVGDPDGSRREEIFDLLNQHSNDSASTHPVAASDPGGD